MKKYFYYSEETEISPLGEDIKVKAEDVFYVALRLLALKIAKEEKNELADGNYNLWFLVPGTNSATLKTKLKEIIKRAFPDFANAADDRIRFIMEPQAAAAYTLKTIVKQGGEKYKSYGSN